MRRRKTREKSLPFDVDNTILEDKNKRKKQQCKQKWLD
jgi:hypothetical protein